MEWIRDKDKAPQMTATLTILGFYGVEGLSQASGVSRITVNRILMRRHPARSMVVSRKIVLTIWQTMRDRMKSKRLDADDKAIASIWLLSWSRWAASQMIEGLSAFPISIFSANRISVVEERKRVHKEAEDIIKILRAGL